MKFKNLLLLAIITFLSSCETDNNPNTTLTEADLIGTWQINEKTLEGSIEIVDNGQTQTATYNAYAKDINASLTFGDNPKKASGQGNYTLVATANFVGQTQTEEEWVELISDPNENPTWSLNGNNITLSNDLNLPQNLIVESYDGKILTLKAEINETETDNGQSVTLKTSAYFISEK